MMAVAAAMYVGIVSALTSSHLPKTHAAAAIGAPLPLVELPLGVEVPAYRSHTHEFTAERLANSPAAFLLRGFLTNDECSALMSAAEESGTFHSAETSGGTSARQKCDIALLGMDCPVVATLTRDAARLLLEPEARMAPGSGCEDVHVLKYGAGGQFLPHYDAVSLPVPGPYAQSDELRQALPDLLTCAFADLNAQDLLVVGVKCAGKP